MRPAREIACEALGCGTSDRHNKPSHEHPCDRVTAAIEAERKETARRCAALVCEGCDDAEAILVQRIENERNIFHNAEDGPPFYCRASAIRREFGLTEEE